MATPSDDDDLLDEALDELDLLDEVAEDMLLEEAAEEDDEFADSAKSTPVVPSNSMAQANRQQIATLSGPPKTWQDTLQILEPVERLEWAKTISKDLSVQGSMPPQPNYSSAYSSGTAGGKSSGSKTGENAGGENAVASLMSGNVVLTPDSPASLFAACLKKALLAVNKEYVGTFSPSPELLDHFREQLATDIQDRLQHHPVERDNVLADPERFPELFHLLQSL
ncbi:Hypothetical Protein FCC1311_056382 [Hondaea fermentalgiana]|uniref:Uncharacterized protein n=1 Tax=Hondaea fermentalgiana TaxID=2315210 RepID=A0A2R5GEQ9_9STRA|nr:Hypothetical Protein FCC1311_056382 [Hondaea fermentalgiana]|eukprot:GBG29417.1 Hypothetical Protein FCC1311_056382 [Hondaea fermentalgiana]